MSVHNISTYSAKNMQHTEFKNQERSRRTARGLL